MDRASTVYLAFLVLFVAVLLAGAFVSAGAGMALMLVGLALLLGSFTFGLSLIDV